MKYLGSKNRIAKHILPIMLEYRTPEMTWVEPFVGGANMIDKVDGKRIGADLNEYLIEALILIRDNHEKIPDLITEDDYQILKYEMKVDGITGFAGFAMSFGGKFFGGYRRDVAGTKGLPKLEPTNIVEPPKRTEFASGKSMPTWYADAWKLPKEERAKLRSKTFDGIAKAMAVQWSSYACR